MAIDGMSMGQIKPSRELPSNILSFEAEELASVEINKNDVGEITAVNSKSIAQKEDNYGEDVSNKMPGDTEENMPQEELEEFDYEEADLKGHKRYSLKFNKENEIVQLYDNKKKCVIRVISEQNLIKIITKVKHPSGIMFTEKV